MLLFLMGSPKAPSSGRGCSLMGSAVPWVDAGCGSVLPVSREQSTRLKRAAKQLSWTAAGRCCPAQGSGEGLPCSAEGHSPLVLPSPPKQGGRMPYYPSERLSILGVRGIPHPSLIFELVLSFVLCWQGGSDRQSLRCIALGHLLSFCVCVCVQS